MTQTEQQLENALIAQLEDLGWDKVTIADENDLLVNLKRQLEKHNKLLLSDLEFRQVLNKLARGNIFEKAKILRDKVDYTRDDGTTGYIELINQIQWCKNQYQVTHQVTMTGKYTNRYDVTLLVNGLPLVQIELKRSEADRHVELPLVVVYMRERDDVDPRSIHRIDPEVCDGRSEELPGRAVDVTRSDFDDLAALEERRELSAHSLQEVLALIVHQAPPLLSRTSSPLLFV